MKNLYIFLSTTIKGVGGEQLYVLSKAKYLVANNWDVIIFYYQNGDLYLKEYNKIESVCIKTLGIPSCYCFKSEQTRVINQMIDFVGKRNFSEAVLESHTTPLSTWGEMLCKKLNIKHIIYNLSETPSCNRQFYNYLKFKYLRKELFGITKSSISYLFKGHNIELVNGSPYLDAYGCSDCVQDVTYDNIPPLEGTFCIGLLGRTDKLYMQNSYLEIINFIKRHPEHLFSVVYIGGGDNFQNFRLKMEDEYKHLDNVCVYFTNYLSPVPLSLVSFFNVCIASAGASWSVARRGIPTITINPHNLKVLGVLGVTTNSSLFGEEIGKTLSCQIEDVFQTPELFVPEIPPAKLEFDKHMKSLFHTSRSYDLSFNKITIMSICKKIYYSLFK